MPVFELRVSDGLWLTNKIALLQLEHFNKSNALGWALTMGLFAMPVIYSDTRVQPDHRGELLHPAGSGGQVRMDGAGRAMFFRLRRTTWAG